MSSILLIMCFSLFSLYIYINTTCNVVCLLKVLSLSEDAAGEKNTSSNQQKDVDRVDYAPSSWQSQGILLS